MLFWIMLVRIHWDNKNIIVILPNALCTSGLSIEGKSGEESVGKFTFECHGDANESLTTLPYKIYYPNASAVGLG